MARPLTLVPTPNEPLLAPDAAEPPLIVSQPTEDVAVQLRVPDPLFDIVTDWIGGVPRSYELVTTDAAASGVIIVTVSAGVDAYSFTFG